MKLVTEGDDLAQLIIKAVKEAGVTLNNGDIFVVAQKIVSKAEGRLVDLNDVTPTAKAHELAEATGKDPRMVELILQQSDEVVAYARGILVVAHKLGLVHANAGIDQSNIEGVDQALLLPLDPDASAAALRDKLQTHFGLELAVVISDSMGRAWRKGIVGTAIGSAGITTLSDLRGKKDMFGRTLEITEVGRADEIAAAASLVQGQAAEAVPVVLLSGLAPEKSDQTAANLLRPKSEDLFR
jgi:coenzyme F420-0:L-glutamate ligase/coenzyme F420-1:gamma-L-glutamate ligase